MCLKHLGHPIYNHPLLPLQHLPSSPLDSACIVSIPKKSQNPLNIDNYKPISILYFFIRIFKRTRKFYMGEYCDTSNSIADFQFPDKLKH